MVFKATCLKTGDEVAIKEVDFSRMHSIGSKQWELLKSEISIMQQLSSPGHNNIVRLRDVLYLTSEYGHQYQYLILDYCNGEEFYQTIRRKHAAFSEPEARFYMVQFGRLARDNHGLGSH